MVSAITGKKAIGFWRVGIRVGTGGGGGREEKGREGKGATLSQSHENGGNGGGLRPSTLNPEPKTLDKLVECIITCQP